MKTDIKLEVGICTSKKIEFCVLGMDAEIRLTQDCFADLYADNVLIRSNVCGVGVFSHAFTCDIEYYLNDSRVLAGIICAMLPTTEIVRDFGGVVLVMGHMHCNIRLMRTRPAFADYEVEVQGKTYKIDSVYCAQGEYYFESKTWAMILLRLYIDISRGYAGNNNGQLTLF